MSIEVSNIAMLGLLLVCLTACAKGYNGKPRVADLQSQPGRLRIGDETRELERQRAGAVQVLSIIKESHVKLNLGDFDSDVFYFYTGIPATEAAKPEVSFDLVEAGEKMFRKQNERVGKFFAEYPRIVELCKRRRRSKDDRIEIRTFLRKHRLVYVYPVLHLGLNEALATAIESASANHGAEAVETIVLTLDAALEFVKAYPSNGDMTLLMLGIVKAADQTRKKAAMRNSLPTVERLLQDSRDALAALQQVTQIEPDKNSNKYVRCREVLDTLARARDKVQQWSKSKLRDKVASILAQAKAREYSVRVAVANENETGILVMPQGELMFAGSVDSTTLVPIISESIREAGGVSLVPASAGEALTFRAIGMPKAVQEALERRRKAMLNQGSVEAEDSGTLQVRLVRGDGQPLVSASVQLNVITVL